MIIDLTKIKTGDIGFVYSSFNLNNVDTWISGFVRFFMNFQAYILGKEKIHNQHCGIFAWVGGQLYFYESVSKGFVSTPAYLKFASRWDNLIVKRYDGINSDPELVVNLKAKYNYLGLLAQLIRQISFNVIDLEAIKTGIKHLFCSQSSAYLINQMSNGVYCQFWQSTDTQDLFFDKASYFVNFK